jgi:hypothetical protein
MLNAVRGSRLNPLPTDDEPPEAFPAHDPPAPGLRRIAEKQLGFVF